MAILYIVATPIGNLGDITYRAVETLKAVDVIACEDTRHTVRLLTHLGIRKPLISCRAHNEETAAAKLIALLAEGQNIAYASDAGTPAISDPGAVLVDAVRRAGYQVSPIPGVSAFSALVSVAGQGGKSLIFEGFLSPKPGRCKSRLLELMGTGYAFVLYESPFRIIKLLENIADIDSGRRVVVGRELTKLHEEIVEGAASYVSGVFSARDKLRGEFAVFVSGVKSILFSADSADNRT